MSSSASSTLWIIHREARARAALARIAGAGDNTVLGAPADDLFASASPADIVLLAPSGDFESELEFAHRFGSKPPGCTWILLPEAPDMGEAKRLFDSLPAQFLRFPPQPDRLRRTIASATRRRGADSLSRRHGRDRLADRFRRWFSDLELPDLLRALDPRLGHLPLLIRGEAGTGRGVVARYVHEFGGSDFAGLLHVPCESFASERELVSFIRDAGSRDGDWRRTIWFEDVDRLPAAIQLRIRDWIDYGLPEGVLRSTRVRFVASAHDGHNDDYDNEDDDDLAVPRLHPSLATALSGLVIELPPLRERAGCIETFVVDSAFAWSQTQGERHRTFSDHATRELTSYPWPGNMAQLEAVVFRSLSHSTANPLEPHHLRFQNELAAVPEALRDNGEVPRPNGEALRPNGEALRPNGEALRPDDEQTLPIAEIINEPLPEPGPFPIPPEPPPATPATVPEVFLEPEPIAEPAPATASPEPAAGGIEDPSVRRLVNAVAHEVRNPLVSIRTFSELLPDHYADEDFRNRFAQLVSADVLRIEQVVARLEELAELGPPQREAVELPALLDRILERNAATIQDRHLLVLKELDRNQPMVLADRTQLDRAFTGMFETALSMVPERGDVYLASKHNTQGPLPVPTVRTLLRYHNPYAGRPLSDILSEDGFDAEGITPSETSLEYLIAEAIIRAQGGKMTLDSTDAQETVIVLDLPSAD